MSFRHYLTIGGITLLTGCSQVDSQSDGLKAIVSRGPQKQAIVRVEGHATQTLGGETAFANKADLALFRQEGYTSAADRFIQMDVLRRMPRGQLSEILGGRKFETVPDERTGFATDTQEDTAYLRDRLALGLGLEEAVQNSWKVIQKDHPETRDLILAYTEGVNAYVADLARLNPKVLRQYRIITRDAHYYPRAWEPQDSVAVAVGVSFHLSSMFEEKMALGVVHYMFHLFEKGPEFSFDMLDLRPIQNSFILGEKYQKKDPQAPRIPFVKPTWLDWRTAFLSFSCVEKGYPFPNCSRSSSFGSNNWVVSSEESQTGKAYLTNDPHLALSNFFKEVSLDSKSAGGTIKVRGVKPPGVPGVLIGHNEDIGWGLTNLGADVDDIYMETFTDDEHTHYASIKGGNPEVRRETYPVMVRQLDGSLLKRPVEVKFIPEHGPVISDHIMELRKQIDMVEKKLMKKMGLSYKWVGHKGTTELVAVLGVNRAKNFDEFKTALHNFKAGSQNFIYGDRSGNIGYYSHGDYPMRPYVTPNQPPYALVKSEKISKMEWAPEFRKEVPERLQRSGFIVTANNDPFGHSRFDKLDDYKDYFGFGFTDGLRAFRIENLLKEKKAAKGYLDAKDMQVIQTDERDELAVHFIELLEGPKVTAALSESSKCSVEALSDWKAAGGVADRNSTAPILFNAFLKALMEGYFAWERLDIGKPLPLAHVSEKELDLVKKGYNYSVEKIYKSSPMIKTLYHKMKGLLASQDPAAFQSGIDLVHQSFEKAKETIKKDGHENSTWGQINRLEFANVLQGLIPNFLALAVERGGSYETVSPAAPGFGANFRMVLSIPQDGSPIEAKISMPGGDFDPVDDIEAFADQVMLWRDGGLRDMVSF